MVEGEDVAVAVAVDVGQQHRADGVIPNRTRDCERSPGSKHAAPVLFVLVRDKGRRALLEDEVL